MRKSAKFASGGSTVELEQRLTAEQARRAKSAAAIDKVYNERLPASAGYAVEKAKADRLGKAFDADSVVQTAEEAAQRELAYARRQNEIEEDLRTGKTSYSDAKDSRNRSAAWLQRDELSSVRRQAKYPAEQQGPPEPSKTTLMYEKGFKDPKNKPWQREEYRQDMRHAYGMDSGKAVIDELKAGMARKAGAKPANTYAKGGSIDGIAQRGKTRGTMR